MGGVWGLQKCIFFGYFPDGLLLKKIAHVNTVLVVIFRNLGDREREGTGPRGVGIGGCMGSSEIIVFWLFPQMDFCLKINTRVYSTGGHIFRKLGDREREGTGPRGVAMGGVWGLQIFFFWLFPQMDVCLKINTRVYSTGGHF